MRLQSTFLALLLGTTVVSALGFDGSHDRALSFSPKISGSSANSSISNGTFTFSHNRASSTQTQLQTSGQKPSSTNVVTTSNLQETTASSSQSTAQIPASTISFTASNNTSTSVQNLTSVSAGYPKPSENQENVKFPNTTSGISLNNVSFSNSQPRVSAKPTSLTLQNRTYAYAQKNASSSESKSKGAAKLAAAVTKAVFAHFMVFLCLSRCCRTISNSWNRSETLSTIQ